MLIILSFKQNNSDKTNNEAHSLAATAWVDKKSR